MDIEDLVNFGTSHHSCPWFSARRLMDRSDIRLVPYQMLFHAATREVLRLSLRDCSIVLDEAHNIVDASNGLYTLRISKEMIQIRHDCLLLFRKNVSKSQINWQQS
jgi:Rad3-related DNA helicase